MPQLAPYTFINTYCLTSLPNWWPSRNIHTVHLITSV